MMEKVFVVTQRHDELYTSIEIVFNYEEDAQAYINRQNRPYTYSIKEVEIL